MPKWNTLEAKDRLLAAVLASTAGDMKKLLDYRKIATYYGEGTTYDSIEGQFRRIRAEAVKLQEAVATGATPQAPPRGNGKGTPTSQRSNQISFFDDDESENPTPKKTRKPRVMPKKTDTVLGNGSRVSKSVTPTKKRGQANVKGVKEEVISSGSSFVEGFGGMDAEGMFDEVQMEWPFEGGIGDYGGQDEFDV